MHLWISKGNGWIEAITGSMFSGKSEELIRRMKRAKYAGQKILVFKHSFDKRYDHDKVVSHSKDMIDAIPVYEAADLKKIAGSRSDVEVIGIDEVQFFGKDIVDVIENLAKSGKRVIVAGLDQDFRGEPFDPMPEILARAEHIDKLNAICVCCGNPASRTQRIINGEPAAYEDPVIMVGTFESYEARCRKCHVVKKKEEIKRGRLIFVVGTDTGIGKTHVTLGFVDALMKKGQIVDVIKPVETGLDTFKGFEGSDSYRYAEKLGKKVEDVNIYFFEKPLSPHLAARLEDKEVNLENIKKIIDEKLNESDILFVEGAGGLIVPFNENVTYLDLIKEYHENGEVIIITENRLGTINHTMMTVKLLQDNGVKINGIYFNNKEHIKDDVFLNENINMVEKLSGEKIIRDYEI